MYSTPMSRTVQIRDLPEDVHRVIRIRAAGAGLSLAEYLRREITRLAERPTVEEFLDQAASVAHDAPAVTAPAVTAAVRADRDRR